MRESKNPKALIPLSSKPHRLLNQSLQLVDKILAKSWTPEQLKVIEFYARYPFYFNDFISCSYPLSEEFLERYKGDRDSSGLYESENYKGQYLGEIRLSRGQKVFNEFYFRNGSWLENGVTGWDWFSLSHNYNLPWSIELIERYKDRWDWEVLSQNKNLPWSKELLERFEDRLVWWGFSDNVNLPWSMELLERFEDRWEWEVLSRNVNLPWSMELLERFEDRWDWYVLSNNENLPWSIELLERFEIYWSEEVTDHWSGTKSLFEIIMRYVNLPWSIELIEENDYQWEWKGLSYNGNLPWSIELIEKYEDRWDWGGLSYNGNLPWSIELIEKFEDQWEWKGLSSNKNLPWSIELIEKYEDRWDWRKLSFRQDFLPWSIKLIENFEDRWDWEGLSYSRWNPFAQLDLNLPWSMELIEKFEDRWDWEGLSLNKYLPWSIELIEKYEDRWDWEGLSNNINIPWTIDLIERYKDRLDWGSLGSNHSFPWSMELLDKYNLSDLKCSLPKSIFSMIKRDPQTSHKKLYNEKKFSNSENTRYIAECLLSNSGIRWTIEFFEFFERLLQKNSLISLTSKTEEVYQVSSIYHKLFRDQIDYTHDYRPMHWEKFLQSYLTDSLIDEIMKRILIKLRKIEDLES